MRWKLEIDQGMLSLKAKYESDSWCDVVSLMQKHCYGE